jgi:exodeoxyribonuclease VII large subunit
MFITTEHKSSYVSVSKLTYQIKQQLNCKFDSVCVQGEIGSIKQHTSGHLYFSIKDPFACLNCVMFKGQIGKMPLPKEGDQIICHGQIDVYVSRGSYQLIVKKIERTGLGALLLELEQLKEELKALGWFDKAHKKPLPKFPKTIGVITSTSGAAIQDIIHVLKRRSHAFHLLIYPVHVQGKEACAEISTAIEDFNHLKNVDVIIIARGGGSIEDLFAFNEKQMCKAIFESQIPILSAVGHEIDFTLCDLVADMRAPTPSAAAEIVVQESLHLEQLLNEKKEQLLSLFQWILDKGKERLHRFNKHPLIEATTLLNPFFQALDQYEDKVDATFVQALNHKKQKLAAKKGQCQALGPHQKWRYFCQKLKSTQYQLLKNQTYYFSKLNLSIEKKQKHHLYLLKQKNHEMINKQEMIAKIKEKLIVSFLYYFKQKQINFSKLCSHLCSLDPKNLMKKGYAILKNQQQKVVTKLNEIELKEALFVQLQDGVLKTMVEEKYTELGNYDKKA